MRGAGLLCAALALCVLGASWEPRPAAAAAVTYPRRERVRKVVGVLAFPNYQLDGELVFRSEDQQLPLDGALEAAVAYLQERLALEDDLAMVGEIELRDRITTTRRYREGILLAREWFNLGVDQFKALRIRRALENLDRAKKLYLEVFQDVVDPFSLAELQLFRGLALGERNAQELAHVAFKRMFAFDPWKRFRPGYYAPATERALQAAVVDFLLTFDRDRVLLDDERARGFLKEMELDALLYGYLGRDGEGRPALHVLVYDRETGRVTLHDTALVDGGAGDRESIDRLVTRWLSCVRWEHVREPEGPHTARLFVDAGFGHSFFLDTPTREFFHNVGFVGSVAWQVTSSFDVFAHFNVMTTLPDSNKDLFRSATTFQAIIGAGFTFRGRRLRFYVHPGIDLNYLGQLAWTLDPSCKFWASLPPEEWPAGACDDRLIDSLDPPILLGINVATGLDIFLTRDLYLNLQAATSFYFFPFEATDTLNFPLMFELKVGYAL